MVNIGSPAGPLALVRCGLAAFTVIQVDDDDLLGWVERTAGGRWTAGTSERTFATRVDAARWLAGPVAGGSRMIGTRRQLARIVWHTPVLAAVYATAGGRSVRVGVLARRDAVITAHPADGSAPLAFDRDDPRAAGRWLVGHCHEG